MADVPMLICVRVTEMGAEPAEGSAVLPCQECGAEVWVAHSSQQMLASGMALRLVCMQCAGNPAAPVAPAGQGDPVRSDLERLRAQAEAAYDRMYEATDDRAAKWEQEIACELLQEAAKRAREAGLEAEARAFETRAEHIKKVFRRQFMQPPDLWA